MGDYARIANTNEPCLLRYQLVYTCPDSWEYRILIGVDLCWSSSRDPRSNLASVLLNNRFDKNDISILFFSRILYPWSSFHWLFFNFYRIKFFSIIYFTLTTKTNCYILWRASVWFEFLKIVIYSYFIYTLILYERQLMLHDIEHDILEELENIVWCSKMLKCDQRNSIWFAVVSCNFKDIESLSTYCHVEIISKCLWDRTIRFW